MTGLEWKLFFNYYHRRKSVLFVVIQSSNHDYIRNLCSKPIAITTRRLQIKRMVAWSSQFHNSLCFLSSPNAWNDYNASCLINDVAIRKRKSLLRRC